MMLLDYTGYYNGITWLSGPSGSAGPTRLIDLRKPGQSMALADAPYNRQSKTIMALHLHIQGGEPGRLAWRSVIGMNGAGSNLPHNVTRMDGYRHGGNNVNFTFFDGHAETRKFQGTTAPYGGFNVLLSTNGKTYSNNGSIIYWD